GTPRLGVLKVNYAALSALRSAARVSALTESRAAGHTSNRQRTPIVEQLGAFNVHNSLQTTSAQLLDGKHAIASRTHFLASSPHEETGPEECHQLLGDRADAQVSWKIMREHSGLRGARHGEIRQYPFWRLTLVAIGVVYGDIGTSPICAFREAVVAATGDA